MLVATLVHWGRFNHGHAPFVGAFMFYGWVAVYMVSSALVGLLWWRNHRTDRRSPQAGEPALPASTLMAARVFGAGAVIGGVALFVAPRIAIDMWPWTLTPLTARVIASFTVQVGSGAVLLSFEDRWSGWRLLAQTFLVATVVTLIGAARAWSDFDQGNPMTWLFIAGLVLTALTILALYRRMELPRASPAPPHAV